VKPLTRQYKCDVNHVDLDRNTALHQAAYYGHADVVATLLDSGLISDLNNKNKYDETALDCAKAGQEAYVKNEFKGPKSFDGPRSFSHIEFTT
jgi:ankyrin repeat protein